MDFGQIALLLVVAALGGILAKVVRQPLIVGYVLGGLALSLFGIIGSPEEISALGKIGITLLLFLVGLEMNIRDLPQVGKVALIGGVLQIILTCLVGFLISSAWGLGILPSLYFALALTFSSTIIIVKLISEKGDLASLYGKISVGFLLVQDLVAVLTLMFLSGVGDGNISILSFVIIAAKASVLLTGVWYLSKKVLPFIFDKFVGSGETLFVGSIAWALGIAAFVGGPLGFSFEIGGFLAGLALSNLPEHLGIASKTRPLRDFFLTIFFIALGAQLKVNDIGSLIVPGAIFSLFVLVGKPLIVMSIMGILRYRKRTSFMTGITLAQVSEFSFILMGLGAGLGHVSPQHVSLIVIVGIVTMTASSYLISESNKVFSYLKRYLSVFERKVTHEEVLFEDRNFSDHVVLMGFDRMGRSLGPYFRKKKIFYLVVDYSPKIFARLSADRIPVILGDVEDEEILSLAKLDHARMVISTVSFFNDNLVILSYIRSLSRRPIVIMKANSKEEAVKLYEKGATYVIVPEVMAGEFLRHIFSSHGMGNERIVKMGKGHFKRLLVHS